MSYLKQMLHSIRDKYGYDFTDYSEASFRRRTDRFMKMNKIHTIHQLNDILLEDANRFEKFVQEITVSVTAMFRDPEFYKSLRKNVLKRLATYPTLKIWLAGCSTGEEVYSLAILLKEKNLLDRSIIYATDINQKSLKIAGAGIYSINNMKEYSDNYYKAGGTAEFSNYYFAKFDSVMLDKSLRKNILFAAHNLVTDKSFNEFHLVLCRNVMIYFNQNLQNKVVNLFYESLCNFGFLALGEKESLLFSDKHKKFAEVDKKEKIYTKKS